MKLKVLGTGCKNCKALLDHTKEAVKAMHSEAEVSYVVNLQEIMSYGVISMPVLVINDQVVSQGKVLKTKEVEALLRQWESRS